MNNGKIFAFPLHHWRQSVLVDNWRRQLC